MQLIEFKLPPPRELTLESRLSLMRSSVSRICTGAKELSSTDVGGVDSLSSSSLAPTEMWMLLLIRMVTRVANPAQDDDMDDDELSGGGDGENGELYFYDRQDKLRHTLLNYVMTDFSSR